MIRSFSWERGAALPTGEAEGFVPEPPPGGWVWVDVAGEGEDTVASVCRSFGIPESFVDEALAPGSLPTIIEQRDLVYVVLNAFRSGSGGRLDTTEVDVFVGPHYLLTVHDGSVPSPTLVRDRLEHGFELAVATPMGLLAHLAMVANRRIPVLIDRLEAQLDDLEELAMRADPRAITEVLALRRDVIVLRRVLVPQSQIYQELADEAGHPLVDDASRSAFQRVIDYQPQILESLDAARSLLGSVLEAHRGAVAEQTNEIVRVLTVFSAIMLPLSLVAGIFGMNFVEIPLADRPLGFWLLVGLMAAGAIALWTYFARRGFVGGPRLRDLPRAVGLGLFHIGVTPIKVVAEGIESTIRYVAGEGELEQESDDIPPP
ncbi:MAG: magnesium transporter CorA family protein [Acidimicrobiia bacterium]